MSPPKKAKKVPLITWANKHLQLSPSFESGEASTHLLHSAFALDAWEQTSWSIGVLIAHFGTEPQHLQLVLDVKFGVMKGVFSPRQAVLTMIRFLPIPLYKAGNFEMSALFSSLVVVLVKPEAQENPHSVENDTAKETMVLEGPILHLS